MNYEDMSLLELREMAKEKELKNVSKMKKQELIDALKELIGDEKNEEEQIKPIANKEVEGSYKPYTEND